MSFLSPPSKTLLTRRSETLPPDSPSSNTSTRPFGPSPIKKAKAKTEDDDEAHQLRMLQRQRDQFIETEILPGETLAAIALKYNVAAAELKRINNIIGEQEFFALKRLKIPAKPLSLLSEQLFQMTADIHTSSGPQKDTNGWLVEHFSSPSSAGGGVAEAFSSEVSSPVLSDESEDNAASDGVFGSEQRSRSQSKHVKKAKKMFRAVDKDLALIRKKNGVSAPIGGQEDGDAEEWEDFDDDLFAKGDLASTQMMLLPSHHSVQVAKVSSVSRALCLGCLGLIVIAVVVILWFAEYEFEAIEHENRTEVEKHVQHLGEAKH